MDFFPAIAVICVLVLMAVAAVRFYLVKPPAVPTHLDKLRDQFERARDAHLTHSLDARRSAALATMFEQQAAWLKQEIDNERATSGVRPDGERAASRGFDIPVPRTDTEAQLVRMAQAAR